MTYHHGAYVSVYDTNGSFMCRGYIVGVYGLSPDFYNIKSDDIKDTLTAIPAARIRKHYTSPLMAMDYKQLDVVV